MFFKFAYSGETRYMYVETQYRVPVSRLEKTHELTIILDTPLNIIAKRELTVFINLQATLTFRFKGCAHHLRFLSLLIAVKLDIHVCTWKHNTGYQ